MSNNHQPTLLVTGASGQLGRRVIELLLESGAGNIIAATRAPEKLADLQGRGVTVRRADFEDAASLAQAFAGVDRLLLISTDAVGEPGRRFNQHLAAVKAAEKAGVSHVVYTSLTHPTPDSPVSIASDHYNTENALEASKLGWTVPRNNIYTDSLLFSLSQAVQMGGLFNAAGDGKVAYVTREDCARAAAAALSAPFTGRRTLDITGSEALSQADLAAITTRVTGKQINYVPLTLEVLAQNLASAGLPPPVIEIVTSFDAGIAQGVFSEVSNTVEELTGRKPITAADFIAGAREFLLQGIPTQMPVQ